MKYFYLAESLTSTPQALNGLERKIPRKLEVRLQVTRSSRAETITPAHPGESVPMEMEIRLLLVCTKLALLDKERNEARLRGGL